MQWRTIRVDERAVADLAAATGLSRILTGMLIRRNLSDPQTIQSFLYPSLKDLPSPGLLPDMDRAVLRIRQALELHQSIVVYGDYDADGLTATALLTDFLSSLGARVQPYVPHRLEQGYGLHPDVVERLAAEGINLIITVDCGTSDLEAANRAKTCGLDIIVTDHHQIPFRLPPAWAVVNPQRSGSRFPQANLAGVGVAFFLAGGLRQALREKGLPNISSLPELAPLLSLVAIGTIADVSPLTHVNRILVRQGLAHLASPTRPGLTALKQVSALEVEGPVTARDVAFRLAPRLNAAGRLGSPKPGLDLLLTRDRQEAQTCAALLESLNQERRRIQEKMFLEATVQLDDLERRRTIVLAQEGWHLGVVGLAAAKLAETYRRPTLLLTLADGLARGSGRSVPGFNLFKSLDRCRDLLLRFGGHERAVGLTLSAENLETLTATFEAIGLEETVSPDEEPVLDIETDITLDDLGGELAGELAKLAPFGEGNPEPVFACHGLRVLSAGCVGTAGRHLKLSVGQNGRTMDLIGFGLGHLLPELGRQVAVAMQRHTITSHGRILYSWKMVDVKREP